MNSTDDDTDAAIYTLFHAIEENCPSDAHIEESFFSFYEVWVLNILVFLVENFTTCLFARCCGSSGNAQADPEEVEKKRQRRRLLNHVLMYTHLTMLAVCTIWYLRHGAPHGRGHPTCPFVYIVCLPLYKPAAGPMWRVIMMVIASVSGGDDDRLERGLDTTVAKYLAGTLAAFGVLMLLFGLPLMLIFLPAFIVAALLCLVILALAVAFAFPCFCCGAASRGGGEAYFKKLAGALWKQSAFLLVGLLAYFCAVFGPFYQRPGDWAPLFLKSWRYVAPAQLTMQAEALLVWPRDMAVEAQALFGVSIAVLVLEFVIVVAIGAIVYKQCHKKPPSDEKPNDGTREPPPETPSPSPLELTSAEPVAAHAVAVSATSAA